VAISQKNEHLRPLFRTNKIIISDILFLVVRHPGYNDNGLVLHDEKQSNSEPDESNWIVDDRIVITTPVAINPTDLADAPTARISVIASTTKEWLYGWWECFENIGS